MIRKIRWNNMINKGIYNMAAEKKRWEFITYLVQLVRTACNAGDSGVIPGLGRSPGEGKGHSLQYSGLENSKDCIVHGVTKSRTQLSDFH